jgi:hypothetical protein
MIRFAATILILLLAGAASAAPISVFEIGVYGNSIATLDYGAGTGSLVMPIDAASNDGTPDVTFAVTFDPTGLATGDLPAGIGAIFYANPYIPGQPGLVGYDVGLDFIRMLAVISELVQYDPSGIREEHHQIVPIAYARAVPEPTLAFATLGLWLIGTAWKRHSGQK